MSVVRGSGGKSALAQGGRHMRRSKGADGRGYSPRERDPESSGVGSTLSQFEASRVVYILFQEGDYFDGGDQFLGIYGTQSRAKDAAQWRYNPKDFKKYGKLEWEPSATEGRCLVGVGQGGRYLVRTAEVV